MSIDPTDILTTLHWEGADLVLMSRVKDVDDTYVLQADVSSIAVKVIKKSDASVVGTASPTVSDVIYDTLQTGNGWDVDLTGYNFRYTVAGTLFPDGDTRYRVQAIATPVTGQPFPLIVADVRTRDLLDE